MADLLLVTGDISGDNYAARLVSQLKEKGFSGDIHAAAGEKTAQSGARLIENLVGHAVIGFAEILTSIPYFYRLLNRMEDFVRENEVKTVVFIDFPGFNLRLASRLKKYDVKLIYYITPQVWAWGENRVTKLGEIFDELLVIFPFEEEFFKERGVKARFVGHPLWEEKQLIGVSSARKILEIDDETPLVSFFPGSRKREIERLLPTMLKTARRLESRHQNCRFVFSAAASIGSEALESFFGPEDLEKFYLWSGPARGLLESSQLAVLASGTVTMEAAFARAPMIVGYKTSLLSYVLGRMVAKVDKAAMPNIISSTNLVPELIQSDYNTENLTQLVSSYISNPDKREKQVRWLKKETEAFEGKMPTEEVAARVMAAAADGVNSCEERN
jgi:lipid-A-disaccharide synthase